MVRKKRKEIEKVPNRGGFGAAEVHAVAYIVKDPIFPDFEVYYNHHATWWMEKHRVEKLIDGLKAGLSVASLCTWVGITERQYKYFREVHPHFADVKVACENLQEIGFMELINTRGKEDLATARWFMDRRHPKFAAKVRVETDEPLQPTINVAVQVNNDIAIQERARDIAVAILSKRRTEGKRESGGDEHLEGNIKE